LAWFERRADGSLRADEALKQAFTELEWKARDAGHAISRQQLVEICCGNCRGLPAWIQEDAFRLSGQLRAEWQKAFGYQPTLEELAQGIRSIWELPER
jgi:hypothetical protein